MQCSGNPEAGRHPRIPVKIQCSECAVKKRERRSAGEAEEAERGGAVAVHGAEVEKEVR